MTVEGARADRNGAGVGPAASWPPAARQLEQQLDGRLLGPGAPGYDGARRVFNAMIDRHPALIVCCRSAEDVVRGVTFARDHELPLAVKAGGHGVAGKAVCDDGLVLDLSPMTTAVVDRAEELAVAQPGLTLGELDAATQARGLATPTGVMSGTGLSGLALGGGLGWLSGRHRLDMRQPDRRRGGDRRRRAADGGGREPPRPVLGAAGRRGQRRRGDCVHLAAASGAERAGGGVHLRRTSGASCPAPYRDLASECADHQTVNASLSLSDEGTLQASIAVCQLGDRPSRRSV